MFRAISTFRTASKTCPDGTPDKHEEVRQKCCDYIVKERHGTLKWLFDKRTNLATDEQFEAYVAKKRSMDGARYTWSDAITANAIAATQGQGPIMQVTYPRWRNGKEDLSIPPKFYILTKLGDRTKLPLFIHYNGINHYNALVPAAWGGATTSSVSPRAGARMGGFASKPRQPVSGMALLAGNAAKAGNKPNNSP